MLRAHLRRVPAFRALLRTVEARLVGAAGPLMPPVLDLGCGDGLFARLAVPGPLHSGLDTDLAALGEPRSARAHHLLTAASATAMPFSPASFATVLANCSLEHIPDLDAALAEVSRVLRPGGRLLATVPSHAFAELLLAPTLLRAVRLDRMARAYGDWFNRHSRHFWIDDATTWTRRLARHGLHIESWTHYFSPAAHRVFDLAHYLGAPRLVLHRLTGRWALSPSLRVNRFFEPWLARYLDESPPAIGAYIALDALKEP